MDRAMSLQRWEALSTEVLSEVAVRSRFPSEKYRVSLYRYPPLTRFGGVMKHATGIVIAGAGLYTFDSEVMVQTGDVAVLPEGPYSLEVLGGDELVIALCWELPFEFNRVQ
jgi:hypothetical protein